MLYSPYSAMHMAGADKVRGQETMELDVRKYRQA